MKASIGLLVLAVLFAAPQTARAANNFDTENAVRDAVGAIKDKVGRDHLRALQVEIDANEVTVQLQDPANPSHIDEWRYGPNSFGLFRSASGPRPVQPQLVNHDLDANLFDLDDIAFADASKVGTAAILRAALEDPAAVTRMEIERQVFILPKPTSGAVRWRVHVSSGRESAEIYADAKGAIVRADLAGTNRMKNLDLFQHPEFAADAARDFRDTVGADPILLKVRVGATSIGFETNRADKSMAQIIASIPAHEAYSWSLDGLKRVMGTMSPDLGLPDAAFGVNDLDWTLLPKILATARDNLGMPKGRASDIELTKSVDRGGVLLWKIVMSDADHGKSTAIVDASGAAREAVSAKSQHKRGEWATPAAIADVLTQLDRALGPGAKYVEIHFDIDKVTITTDDPQHPGQTAVLSFNERGLERMPAAFAFLGGKGKPFTMAELGPLAEDKVAAIQNDALGRVKLPAVLDFQIGRGLDPAGKGRLVIEVSASKPPFDAPLAPLGRAIYEANGKLIGADRP